MRSCKPTVPVVQERHEAIELVTLVFEISVIAGPAVGRFAELVRTKVAARNAGKDVDVRGEARLPLDIAEPLVLCWS